MATILITRFSSLGDVAISVPLLYALAQNHPEHTFLMVSQPSMVGLFENCPTNLIFISAWIKGKHKGIPGLYRLYKELSKKNIDVICDIHGVHRSRILNFFFFLKNIPVYRIDKGRKERRSLTRRRKKVLSPLKSSFEKYRSVFRQAGFFITEDEVRRNMIPASTYLPEMEKKYGEKDSIWLGIAPFARYKGKSYPFEKMEQVVAHFSDDDRFKVFLFGGGQEELVSMTGWKTRYPSIQLSDNKGLSDDIRLMNCLNLLLTMDSANLHLGSMAHAKVVSIWGATHPYAGFSGLYQPEENEIQRVLSCRPCSIYGNKPCFRKDYACLNEISPEVIIEKINKECGLI